MPSSPIYVVANGRISFFLKDEFCCGMELYCVCVYTHIHTHDIFFIHLSADVHLGCFYVLAIMNNDTVNMEMQIFL